MRIVLTTGGTGGHIFPALAVAEQLKQRGAELLFIGSTYGHEAELVAKAGIPFQGLNVQGVLRRGVASFAAVFHLLAAVFPAKKILKDFHPQVVAGFGAYASFAPLVAAKWLGIPITLHEQNAIPGLSNKILGKLAKKIFLSLPQRGHFFNPQICIITGNPVRESIRRVQKRTTSEKHLLITGGSQGAKAVNSVILANLERLIQAGVQIRHQCGSLDLERVKASYISHGYDTSNVYPFIDNMAEAYTWADLVVCRAGATSVAELTVAGKPSILIPFPYATHDHQTQNAAVLSKAGAACLVPQNEIGKIDIGGMILALLNDEKRLQNMAKAALDLAKPDAAAAVAQGILDIA